MSLKEKFDLYLTLHWFFNRVFIAIFRFTVDKGASPKTFKLLVG
jgi:hypothetical protein